MQCLGLPALLIFSRVWGVSGTAGLAWSDFVSNVSVGFVSTLQLFYTSLKVSVGTIDYDLINMSLFI